MNAIEYALRDALNVPSFVAEVVATDDNVSLTLRNDNFIADNEVIIFTEEGYYAKVAESKYWLRCSEEEQYILNERIILDMYVDWGRLIRYFVADPTPEVVHTFADDIEEVLDVEDWSVDELDKHSLQRFF